LYHCCCSITQPIWYHYTTDVVPLHD
jgi:hypothetical protein